MFRWVLWIRESNIYQAQAFSITTFFNNTLYIVLNNYQMVHGLWVGDQWIKVKNGKFDIDSASLKDVDWSFVFYLFTETQSEQTSIIISKWDSSEWNVNTFHSDEFHSVGALHLKIGMML